MAEHGYTHHFRDTTMTAVAELLGELDLQGIVLSNRGRWTCALLPRSPDDDARLTRLVDRHSPGVLLLDAGSFGHRIVFGRAGQRWRLSKETLQTWVDLDLLDPRDLPQLQRCSLGGIDWPDALHLPRGAWMRELADATRQDWDPPAIPVNVAWEGRTREPAHTDDDPGVFALLVGAGFIQLATGADAEALTDEAEDLLDGGTDAATFMTWLLEHPAIEDVFLADDALARALEA